MSNAIALVRCSTQSQAEMGISLHSQEDAIGSYAEKKGLTIIKTFVDAGVSGGASLDKRPGLLGALAELGKGDTLLVAKYDRLARDLMLQLTIERMVSRKGAFIVAVDNEGASGDDPSATLLRRLLASVSEYEKAVISIRTKDANKARRKRNLPCSHAPYGFKVGADGCLVEEPTENQTWIRAMAIRNEPIQSGLSSKGLSWRLVALALNDEGFTNRAGNPWTIQNLFQINKWRNQHLQNAAHAAK